MARRNTSTGNAPYAINANNYISTTDKPSDTLGAGGSPRNSTSIWAKLFSLCFDVEWTIAAEGSNSITVTAQLMDMKGRNLGRPALVDWSLHASDAAGVSYGLIDNANTGLTVSTGISVNEWNADCWVSIQSDTDGKIVTAIEDTTGADHYKVQIAVGDRIFQSPLITFAA